MPTHTFIADNANAAVARIRAELGPAAVVQSVRKLPRNGLSRILKKDQIEVVASVPDVPPSESRDSVQDLHKEIRALKLQFAELRMAQSSPRNNSHDGLALRLSELGILPCFYDELAEILPARASEAQLHQALRSRWKGEPDLEHAAVHLFIGVPGCGKSTVLCKLLAQIALVEQHPATLYQLDTNIANTSAKPALFAEIVGAQYERTAPLAFERCEESDFIDLPGVPMGDQKGLKALRGVIESFGVPEVHLVLNGAYEAAHLLEQVRFFGEVGITDLVVSHLDEEPRWGKVWNLILGTNFAVRYLSSGQNIPGGLHKASPDLLLHGQIREN